MDHLNNRHYQALEFHEGDIRFLRALEVEAALAREEAVEPELADWLTGYQTTAEYKAHRDMIHDFGDDVYLPVLRARIEATAKELPLIRARLARDLKKK